MSTPQNNHSAWAKDTAEEDRVELMIRKAGCWDHHLAVVECMGDNSDWRKCQQQLKDFKLCVQNSTNKIDVEKEKARKNEPPTKHIHSPFSPCYHNKNWYLNEEYHSESEKLLSETELFRAAALFQSKQFDDALNIFLKLHSSAKYNRFQEIMLVDSILQCYAKIGGKTYTDSSCEHFIDLFENLIVDFGDQIQFLLTKSKAMSSFEDSNSSEEFLDTVSLLCSLSDLPENWLLFGSKKSIVDSSTNNFKLAYLVHCLVGYEHQCSQANGFVKSKILRDIETIRAQIREIEPDQDKIDKISSSMSVNLRQHRVEFKPSVDAAVEFRAHDCRLKNKFVAKADQAEMISSFKMKYQFLFDNIKN